MLIVLAVLVNAIGACLAYALQVHFHVTQPALFYVVGGMTGIFAVGIPALAENWRK